MPWITVREARETLDNRVGTSTIHRLVKSGEVEGTQIAGRVLIDRDSWTDYIARGRIRVLIAEMPDKPSRIKRRSA